MQSEEIYERSKLNANTYRLISYTLVSLMIACAAATLANLANSINPNFRPYYWIGLGFIVALDRLYTFKVFHLWLFLSREWILLAATHAVVIVAITKVTVGLTHGWNAFLADIPTWWTHLPFSFFDAETTFSLFLILLVWLVCGRFADLLEEIGPDQIQTAHLELVNDPKANIPARRRLIHLFFMVGAFLVVATMLSRISLRMDFSTTTYNPSIPVPVLAVGGISTLLYFMLGLALLSQTQFISLHVRWNIQRIPISGTLARQWTIYSMIFLAIIAALVTLIPTSYGIHPLEMLGYALNMIVYVVLFGGQMIFMGIMAVLSIFFGKDPPQQNPNVLPPDMPGSPTPDPSAPALPDWLELLKAIIFWIVLTGAIVWAIRQYLRQNRQLLEKLRGLANWGWLKNIWAWLRSLWSQVKTGLETVASIARKPNPSTASHQTGGDGFINLRRLDPRQKVYFFYLAFVRRAGEKNLPRSSHQTPGEYASTLQNALPEAADDIRALTEAFVSARYSRRPVETTQAHNAETIWARLRKALKRPADTKS